jgi:maltose alpha-D-glucosyltransferase/alpha-amylase
MQFLDKAHELNMKVIVDLVLNHTSDQHPWFRKARSNDSTFTSWYVWSANRPKDADKGMVFPGVQKETWSFDTAAKAFYFHRFYRFQPDLNYTNVNVQKEAFAIIDYWLKLGLDGYRLDAVPFIIDIPETGSEKPERMLWLIGAMARQVHSVNKNAILLGEANLSPDENADYFEQDGDGIDMMFNFYANQYLFYSLTSKNVKPLIKALEATRKKPWRAQWAFFLRNHDE